jgi:rubrerythrin
MDGEEHMNDEHEEHDADYEDEWTCDVCGGPMYKQAHWHYAQCDDCGARQELIDDDYT